LDDINSWGNNYVQKAIEWGKSGGIVTMSWHWRLGGADFYSPAHYWPKPGGTSFPDGDIATNEVINKDLKQLGDKLQMLADAKIPVMWRPLHEPPGNWFWWHTAGSQKYVQLWKYQYDYLVNKRGINNLIWVYSGSEHSGYKDQNWYPGNEYVDIAAVDGYGGKWKSYFNGLTKLSNG
jgi:mannan endo-1,4-beta-mannosidase